MAMKNDPKNRAARANLCRAASLGRDNPRLMTVTGLLPFRSVAAVVFLDGLRLRWIDDDPRSDFPW